MRRLLTLVGVYAIGEGLVLALSPRGYLNLWAGVIGELMAKVKPGLERRPEVARLLGVAELGLGIWFVTQRLCRTVEPGSPAEARAMPSQ